MSHTSKDHRYHRQELLSEIGESGQQRLAQTKMTVIGCGALGSVQAELLARAGVGALTLVDRDVVELHNLQRQLLYDEQDAQEAMPKAEAAERRVRRVNSAISVEGKVQDVTSANVEALVRGADVVLDGTDNLETRYLLNDACVKHGVPWIYGGAVGTEGLQLTVVPGEGPCLRCVFPEPPAPGVLPTCDTAGVLAAVTTMVAAQQVAEALRLAVVASPTRHHWLRVMDPWQGAMRQVRARRDPACPCCAGERYEYLHGEGESWTTTLCGRNAVQITPASRSAPAPDLEALARRLTPHAEVSRAGLSLRCRLDDELVLVVFPDGRTLVEGTTDEPLARSLFARYIGM